MVIDNYYKNKLKELGINIKSTYIVNGKLLERNSDNSKNDNVVGGVLYEKEYFKEGKSIYKETEFDTRIEYTFYQDIDDDSNFTCANCGVTRKFKEFSEGCPYCKTNYNIDYKEKELGSKYHYDSVLRSNTYKIVTLIVDIIISMILSFLFIKYTSRTFNNYDFFKVIIFGIMLSLALYYVFYLLDAYIVLKPIKKYKEKNYKKQVEFWNTTKLDKKKFYNNLKFEIDRLYFNNQDIIDYDIVDYDKFESYLVDNKQYVDITMYIRIIYYSKGKIKSKIQRKTFKLKKNDGKVLELNNEVNLVKCPGCGSNVDVLLHKCSYCGTELGNIMEWRICN